MASKPDFRNSRRKHKKHGNVPRDRLLALLNERTIRGGTIQHANSMGIIHQTLVVEGADVTLSTVSKAAKEMRNQTGRTAKINQDLGRLARYGTLFDDTRPCNQKELGEHKPPSTPKMTIKVKVPWLFNLREFQGTDHRTLEHYYRMGDPGRGIDVVAPRGMNKRQARGVLREIEEHYRSERVA